MGQDQISRKTSNATTMSVREDLSESTPLIERKRTRISTVWKHSVVYRVLLTSFLVSLSFGVTQVPLIYVFGLMTCDEYYAHHPGDPGAAYQHCKVHQIEANTARSVALLGASTTMFGVINLFFTGWTMKAFGVKKALQLSVFFPAVRLAIQNFGVETGAGLGIIIVQCSQIITVVGGPVGYLLALNSFATEVVEPAERTATLGRLSGCAMFGTAVGYLAGGLIGDIFGIIWPFRVTLALFLLCSLYISFCLPTIHNKDVETNASRSLASFFDPIKIFTPQKWRMANGVVQKQYGVLLLGIGVFLGVLATSYIPVLLQMYSTDVFGFGTSENGLLISVNSLVRGVFLTLAFPAIISSGRKWIECCTKQPLDKIVAEDARICNNPPDANQVTPNPGALENPGESREPEHSDKREDSLQFDLVFTQYSLILDGILTGLAYFTNKGWQMYVIAVVLPLASGTGPAAKGTILQMCSPAQRTDALSAISLVELVARLSSTSLFGLVFAAFADVGQPNLTFAVNAAIAVVGFIILMFVGFPPSGSSRYVKEPKGSEFAAGEAG